MYSYITSELFLTLALFPIIVLLWLICFRQRKILTTPEKVHTIESDTKKKQPEEALIVGNPTTLVIMHTNERDRELDPTPIDIHCAIYHSGRSDDKKRYYPNPAPLVSEVASMSNQTQTDKLVKMSEVQMEDLRKSTHVYHSGRSDDNKKYSPLNESKIDETTTVPLTTPGKYSQGVSDIVGTTSLRKDMKMVPLRNAVAVYHSGQSVHPESDVSKGKYEESSTKGWLGFLGNQWNKEKPNTGNEPATMVSFYSSGWNGPPVGNDKSLNRMHDLEMVPLRTQVNVYHSGYSMLPVKRDKHGNIKRFNRVRWPSDINDTGEKQQARRDDYAYLNSSSNTKNVINQVSKTRELCPVSIKQECRIYHRGQSYVKTKHSKGKNEKLLKRKGSSSSLDTSSSSLTDGDDENSQKRNIFRYLRSPYKKNQVEKNTIDHMKAGMFDFFKKKSKDADKKIAPVIVKNVSIYPTSEKYDGLQDNLVKFNEIDDIPIKKHTNIYHSGYSIIPGKTTLLSPFLRFIWRGEEETVNQTQIKSKEYPSKTEKYVGTMNEIGKMQELPPIPIKKECKVYHSGKSHVKDKSKKKRMEKIHSKRRASTSSTSSSSSSSTDGKGKGSKKLHALVYLHSHIETGKTIEKMEEDEDKARFFDFFKGRPKEKTIEGAIEPAINNVIIEYPKSEKYDGPNEALTKADGFEDAPLKTHVEVYHSGYSIAPGKTTPLFPFRRFVWGGDEEIVHKPRIKSDEYPSKTETYVGPVDEIDKMREFSPVEMRKKCKVYHLGQSHIDDKFKKTNNEKITFQRRASTSSTRSSSSSSTDGEGKKPHKMSTVGYFHSLHKHEKTDKKKDEDNAKAGFFDFLKGKPKDGIIENENAENAINNVIIEYPKSEKYDGPNEALTKADGFEDAPLKTHVEVYHSGYSIAPGKTTPLFPFRRFVWGGDEEIVHKPRIKSDEYPSKTETYVGPVDEIDKMREFSPVEMRKKCKVYHLGQSHIDDKFKKTNNEKITFQRRASTSSTRSSSSSSTDGEGKKPHKMSTVGYFHSLHKHEKTDKKKDEDNAKAGFFDFLKGKPKDGIIENENAINNVIIEYPKSEKYDGPNEALTKADGFEDAPLKTHVEVYHSGYSIAPGKTTPLFPFRRFVCGGDEEIVHKPRIKSDEYPLKTETYVGPVDEIDKMREFSPVEMRKKCKVYHLGQSHIDDKFKKTNNEKMTFQRRASTSSTRSSSSSSTDGEGKKPHKMSTVGYFHSLHKHEKADKKKDENNAKTGFFDFLKGRPKDGIIENENAENAINNVIIEYPKSEKYDGPHDALIKAGDFEDVPLKTHVEVYHSGYSIAPEKTTQLFPFRRFIWGDEEEILQNPHIKLDEYSSITAKYFGSVDELGRTVELSPVNIKKECKMYHSGQSHIIMKSKEEKNIEKRKSKTHKLVSSNSSSSRSSYSSSEGIYEFMPRMKKSNSQGLFGFLKSGKMDFPDKEKEKKKHGKKEKKVGSEGNGCSHDKKDEQKSELTNYKLNEDSLPFVIAETMETKNEGTLVKTVNTTETYKISGFGDAPRFDGNDTSLERTLQLAQESSQDLPKVEKVEKHVTTVFESGTNIPSEEKILLSQTSEPHTTIKSWQENVQSPETVITECDEFGNIIRRTMTTQQTKQTIQKQTYQTYAVPMETSEKTDHQVHTYLPIVSSPSALGDTDSHTNIVYASAASSHPDVPGEFVSSRIVTSGSRTIETITYKTVNDGIVETHVEHRVAIHSNGDIDHDTELNQAIMEATNMNPDMTVEKVEVAHESSS